MEKLEKKRTSSVLRARLFYQSDGTMEKSRAFQNDSPSPSLTAKGEAERVRLFIHLPNLRRRGSNPERGEDV